MSKFMERFHRLALNPHQPNTVAMDGYDAAKDGHDSYYAAIEAKRKREDAAMDDHAVCKAVRSGRAVPDTKALLLAQDRGLIDSTGETLALTPKGAALLDGIEPTACSGWHMGGAAPAGDWRRRRNR